MKKSFVISLVAYVLFFSCVDAAVPGLPQTELAHVLETSRVKTAQQKAIQQLQQTAPAAAQQKRAPQPSIIPADILQSALAKLINTADKSTDTTHYKQIADLAKNHDSFTLEQGKVVANAVPAKKLPQEEVQLSPEESGNLLTALQEAQQQIAANTSSPSTTNTTPTSSGYYNPYDDYYPRKYKNDDSDEPTAEKKAESNAGTAGETPSYGSSSGPTGHNGMQGNTSYPQQYPQAPGSYNQPQGGNYPQNPANQGGIMSLPQKKSAHAVAQPAHPQAPPSPLVEPAAAQTAQKGLQVCRLEKKITAKKHRRKTRVMPEPQIFVHERRSAHNHTANTISPEEAFLEVCQEPELVIETPVEITEQPPKIVKEKTYFEKAQEWALSVWSSIKSFFTVK